VTNHSLATPKIMPPARVTVMGGLGFMGSHICRALLANGHPIRVFSKLYSSRDLVGDIADRLEIIEADIMQPREVLDAIGDSELLVDLVHTTRPGSSMRDPVYDASSNILGHVQWLQHLAETKLRRILFVSSGGTVYGAPQRQPVAEDHPTNPISAYGISKLAIEKYLAMYARQAGVSYTIMRPGNVYGPGVRLNVGQGVIGALAQRALRGEPLEVWGSGNARRDYLYIDDFVSAFLALLRYEGAHSIFNVSSGSDCSVTEIIAMLASILKVNPIVVHTDARGFDVPVNVLDSSLLTNETGWKPATDLETGITKLVDWLR
jgi:UDP-glucose 4-epimerase